MNTRGAGEVYDIVALNKSLDDLGMLSTLTTSRKEYLQECLRDGMEKLNVDQPGPSTSRWDSQKSPKSSGSSHSVEKENTNIGGFQVLTMNSTFITSFKAGYELPCHGIKEPSSKRVYKCSFSRRRRLRTHPYDNNSAVSNTSEASGYSSGSYRLRTTSLSSGTSKNKNCSSYSNAKSSGSSGHVLVRSRSMENLTASMDEGLILASKPRELESVSRGIQQLRMDDCT
ncbi:uncharacterized protein LOC121856915 isoform X2 [Homarus americanus]|nr:uncharacterized protein LOC121856915 isoform X2 [Homarus americanus]